MSDCIIEKMKQNYHLTCLERLSVPTQACHLTYCPTIFHVESSSLHTMCFYGAICGIWETFLNEQRASPDLTSRAVMSWKSAVWIHAGCLITRSVYYHCLLLWVVNNHKTIISIWMPSAHQTIIFTSLYVSFISDMATISKNSMTERVSKTPTCSSY